MSAKVLRRQFTVDEYHCMAQAGILREDDRVELVEGEVLTMAPIGSLHSASVNRLTRLFSERAGREAIVSVQNPIRLGEYSEPQPDLSLLRPRPDFYSQAHPGPEDLLLVVEVADTSAEYDREVKIRLYAGWGITEVWLVDLTEGAIEVYRTPSAQGYQEVRSVRRGDRLAPQALPELELGADEVLG